MIERDGGLWLAPDGQIVFERYDAQRDRIALICKRSDGRFEAWRYKKGLRSELYCLPFWEPINDKVILPSQEEAIAYLGKPQGDVP